MKWTKTAAAGVVALLALASLAGAQNKSQPHKAGEQAVPLKVEVVLKESGGTEGGSSSHASAKTVSSLPYTLSVIAYPRSNNDVLHMFAPMSKLRMGIRVPYPISAGSTQFQYQNVGTEIDCQAEEIETGLFRVSVTVQHSSVYSPQSAAAMRDQGAKPSTAYGPIFSTFSGNLELLMRNGQTTESTVATDPVSGRVLRVAVTLHVLK